MNLPPTSRLLFPHPPGPHRPHYDHRRRLRRKGLLNALFPIGRENDDSEELSHRNNLTVTPATLVEQELAAAQAAQQDGNDGKARVCARRAVALATDVWLARLPIPLLRGDAMAQLRQIQQNASLPLPIRQAAERLSTPVTRRHTAPFTTDPVADAILIINHLSGTTSDRRS